MRFAFEWRVLSPNIKIFQPNCRKPDGSGTVLDAYFDSGSEDLREDGRNMLQCDAQVLKDFFVQSAKDLVIEGHADEIEGSSEYCLGLGDRRAQTVKNFFMANGVAGSRLRTVSYGKERPQCPESDASCRQKNRRAHFSVAQ
jgi:peptidoglycan-associated lipoprotein